MKEKDTERRGTVSLSALRTIDLEGEDSNGSFHSKPAGKNGLVHGFDAEKKYLPTSTVSSLIPDSMVSLQTEERRTLSNSVKWAVTASTSMNLPVLVQEILLRK